MNRHLSIRLCAHRTVHRSSSTQQHHPIRIVAGRRMCIYISVREDGWWYTRHIILSHRDARRRSVNCVPKHDAGRGCGRWSCRFPSRYAWQRTSTKREREHRQRSCPPSANTDKRVQCWQLCWERNSSAASCASHCQWPGALFVAAQTTSGLWCTITATSIRD